MFATVYKFVKKNYTSYATLWDSARSEMLAFLGLMPLVVSDWGLEWSCDVWAFGSCPEGRGSCWQKWELDQVKIAGRTLERSRFKRVRGGRGFRERALRDLDSSDPLSIISPAPDFDRNPDDWKVLDDFVDVDSSLVAGVDWKVVYSDPWVYQITVHMGEAREAVITAGHIASTKNGGNRRASVG